MVICYNTRAAKALKYRGFLHQILTPLQFNEERPTKWQTQDSCGFYIAYLGNRKIHKWRYVFQVSFFKVCLLSLVYKTKNFFILNLPLYIPIFSPLLPTLPTPHFSQMAVSHIPSLFFVSMVVHTHYVVVLHLVRRRRHKPCP